MLIDAVVNIPEKVKFNAKNSGTYVYHVYNSSYSKEKKFSTDKRVLIGKKIDDKTMKPNKRYFEIYKVKMKKEQEMPKEFSDTLSVGDTALIQAISSNIGLDDCLIDVFGKENKNMIMNLASYHIIENSSVYQHYPTFAFKHPVLGHKTYTDSYISKFLSDEFNDSLIHNFFDKWIKNQNLNGTIMVSYDSTNINCESDGIELNEYGKAKDDEEKRIINLSYVFDQDNGTPLFYELYSGSITDIAECNKMLKLAKKYGLNHAIFIADRGYFSSKNIYDITKNFDGFIMMAKINNKIILNTLDENKSKISAVPNYIDRHEVFGYKISQKLFKEDADAEKRYFYYYFSQTKYNIEKENLTRVANKNYLEAKSLIGKTMDVDASLYPYCKFIIDEKNIVKEIEFNQELFDENLKTSGYFVIVSTLDDEPSRILDIYRNRDSIEKSFRALKTDLGFSKLGVQSTQNLRSKIFISFISSIIRNHILKSLISLKAKNKKEFTVNAVLNNLSRIEATKFSNKDHEVLYSLTKTQKEIIKACGVNISNINKKYPNY